MSVPTADSIASFNAATGRVAPNVRTAPATYDVYLLDGQVSPGLTEIESGGDAADEIADQRQLLTKGATTVDRGWINSEVTYKHTLYTDADFAAWLVWQKMLLEGRNRTPKVRNYLYQDLRGGWVKRVIFQKLTMQKCGKPGGPWYRSVTLHENRLPAPIGGPVLPPDANDRILAANSQTIQVLNQQLANAQAGATAQTRTGKP